MNEILIAILSFTGAVLGTLLTIKLGYKELYTKNVTSNRMEWINVWRNTIPKFIAHVDLILNEKKKDCNNNSNNENLLNFYQSKYIIEIRLNLNESKHQMVYNLLNNITDCLVNSDFVCFQKVNNYKQQLLVLSRTILKEEWERVKKESKRCFDE